MAIINSLAIGKARKSAGNLTFATIQGRTIAREKPVNVKNPRTDKQLAQRSKMSNTVAAYRNIGIMVKHLFTKLPKYTSQYNQFVKENIKIADKFEIIEETGKVTNVGGLMISNGDILPFKTVIEFGYGEATVSWEQSDASRNFIKSGDYWEAVVVDQATGDCHTARTKPYGVEGETDVLFYTQGETFIDLGVTGPSFASVVYYSPSRNLSSAGRLELYENIKE